MKNSFLAPLAGALLAVSLTGCDPALHPVDEAGRENPDPHSFANYEQVRTEHVSLVLAADFDTRTLQGHVTLELDAEDAAERLVLDTRALDIRDVNQVDAEGGLEPLSWRLGEADPERRYLGAPLIIALRNGVERVRIDYTTSPEAYGLQWLDAGRPPAANRFCFRSRSRSSRDPGCRCRTPRQCATPLTLKSRYRKI